MPEGFCDDIHQMCLLSFIHTWIGFLTLKTYLFGMFVLYTKLIGFVNRENEKIKKIFWAVWSGVAKRKSTIFGRAFRCYEFVLKVLPFPPSLTLL